MAIVNVASPYGATQVNSAISSASSGDTVLMPSGQSVTWTAAVTLNKGITLDGNGCNITRSMSGSGSILNVTTVAGNKTRVTGFNWHVTGWSTGSNGYNQPMIATIGGGWSNPKFLYDNNTHASFGDSNTTHLRVNDALGVIYNNTFNTGEGGGEIIHVEAYGNGSTTGWSYDITQGSDDAVYIEDNDFINATSGNPAYFWGGSAVQSYYGSRTVFRYNNCTMCQIDQHGTAGQVGARWFEIYENTYIVSANGNQSAYVTIRGGSGVIFNNYKTGSSNSGAGGIDFHEDDSGGYPQNYQPGRGKNQTLDPVYVWGNDADFGDVSYGNLVQQNRDVYESSKSGYTPYTYPHPLRDDAEPELPVFDPARVIDWTACGIAGGIPTRDTIFANVTSYGATGNGSTDDSGAIQDAIDACPVGQVVYIPAGTYRLNSELSLTKGIVLRGAGRSNTLLKSYAEWHALQIGDFPATPVDTNVSGSPAKGATTITVASVTTPALSIGDYIVIDQINDGSEVINVDDFSRDSNTRCLSQITKITDINSLTLTIDPALHHAYVTAQTPQVWKLNQGGSVTANAGIENLYVERVSPTGTEGYSNIKIVCAVNCWMRGVESKLAQFRHVDIDRSFRCEIRDNYFNDGMHHDVGGFAYGVVCANRATANLVEDNIFYHLRHSMVIKEGATGNVYGYNYSVASWQGDGWLAADMSTHGSHACMNLFEGNYVAQIRADWTHGSGSYNTYFRNNVIRDSSATTVTGGRRCVDIERTQWYYNFVGNILGKTGQSWTLYEDTGTRSATSGLYVYTWGYADAGDSTTTDVQSEATAYRHGNYDFQTASTIWDGAVSDHVLVDSLYRASKPSFFGSIDWPPIGSDISPMVTDIPAKVAYDAGQMPGSFDLLPAPTNLHWRPHT